ncbi:ATP-binding SpoIIE family protein phosphatase [Streptomyces malaysiensis]|uniref:ATP-binding SpoIIE family protein phosphatase n=1 Tax=Streptomyces malaysiensis TaxID=92644 RepID=UPI003D2F6C22
MSSHSDGESIKRWAFEQHPVATTIYDRDGRLLFMNTSMRQATRLSEEATRGQLLTEIVQGGEYAEIVQGAEYEELQQRIFRVLETGHVESYEFFVRLASETKAHAWIVDVVPLKDEAGRIHGASVSAYDYSEQYESRERLALLSEARSHIGASLDVADTAREFTEVTVDRFADVVSVDLLGPVFQGDLPGSDPAEPVPLRRAAYRSAYSGSRGARATGELGRRPTPRLITRCLATGQAELHQVTDPDVLRWLIRDPDQEARALACAVHSMIVVPVRALGATLGVVVFLRCGSRAPFARGDLAVTEDLVTRAAVCLDNARRYLRERTTSETLQRSLLPRKLPDQAALEIASRYLPAEAQAGVGGDWFDVIPLSGARVALVVGDVVGHGLQASVTMARLRTAVRSLADLDLPPDELLTHLDDIVIRLSDDVEADAAGDVGATCLYAVYDPVSRRCTLARAGHPLPTLRTPDGSTTILNLPAGPPLGLGGLPFEAVEVDLPEGSLLALYTDGLIESRGRDIDEGFDALRQALNRPTPSLEAACDAVLEALPPTCPDDDVALLLARTRALSTDQVATWDLPRDPATVATTRQSVSEKLTDWGLEELSFVTVLVVSELVTNAIRYGQSPIQLRLILPQPVAGQEGTPTRPLICEVSDASSTSPHLRRARVFDEGGRGLLLVAQLTQRWGTRHARAGKTIWAEQVLPAS